MSASKNNWRCTIRSNGFATGRRTKSTILHWYRCCFSAGKLHLQGPYWKPSLLQGRITLNLIIHSVVFYLFIKFSTGLSSMATYISETGKNFITRLTEHTSRNTKKSISTITLLRITSFGTKLLTGPNNTNYFQTEQNALIF